MSNRPSDLSRKVIPVIGVVLLALAVKFVPAVAVIENLTRDVRMYFTTPAAPTNRDIVLLTITEDTISALPYRSPIDRALLAGAVETVLGKNARQVGLDILFDQATEEHKDEQLRTVLVENRDRIVVVKAGKDGGLTDAQQQFERHFLRELEAGSGRVFPDPVDATIREVDLRDRASSQPALSFSALIAQRLRYAVPDRERLRVDYRRTGGQQGRLFATYPLQQAGLLPESWLAGKIVLIGSDMPLVDRHITPLARWSGEGTVAGVRIHAQSLAQLIDGRELIVPELPAALVVIVLAALAGLTLGQWRQRGGLIVAGALVSSLVYLLIVGWVYQAFSVFLDVVPVLLALAGGVSLAMLAQWRREQQQRKLIQTAFSRYLSPKLVTQLLHNPDAVNIGGEQREITFLFTDLAGFTPLTELLEPRQLVALINEYLDETSQIVMNHGGMVAAIVGDALNAMFNAPMLQNDHAQRAVRAALELDRFCTDFQRVVQARGIDLDVTRIGINTGTCVLGNFGGSRRMEYTAMGDPINTAARLESANRYLGTRICVSQSTVDRCEGIVFRPIGELLLKGKSSTVMTHEPLIGLPGDNAALRAYREAYAAMASRDSGAEARFLALRDNHGTDPLIDLHITRLRSGAQGATLELEEK